MRPRMRARRAARTSAAALLLLAAGCGHLHWPHKSPPPPPPTVHELDVSGAGGASYPQSWKRNTLLVDLGSAGGTGGITVKPLEDGWPVRLAFRVTPGAFAVLTVKGDERVSLPINPTGSAPIDLELPPGVYTAKTAQLEVSWGAAPVAVQ